MAQPAPDIQSILAALAQQRPATSSTPQAPPPQAAVPSGYPPGFPVGIPSATPPTGPPGFQLPQPTGSGSLDLKSITPNASGRPDINDAVAKARAYAASKGLSQDGRNSAVQREDPRLAGRSSYSQRSRSRSPPRRDEYRSNYAPNPYRDERRDDPRRGGLGYRPRERSRSPERGRDTFSPGRAYGGRRSPQEDNTEMIMIDSALVGLVIGRQGENLRRVEAESGTRIQFMTGPEAQGPQRQCKITGPLRARMDAKREIYRIIDENGGNVPKDGGSQNRGGGGSSTSRGKANNQPALRAGEDSVQIMVPDRTVGLIIGRGGETIRDLQERSQCHVNIVGENKSVNGLRPVNLIGTHAAAARAKELIMEIVDSDTRSLTQPQDSGRGRNDNYQQDSGYGGHTGGSTGKINDSIMVPSDSVGMIIGKGGETIREMQNQTGCKINVSQASGPDIEREIGLVGSRQAIEAAKKAIWDKVDSVKERAAGGGGRRGGGRDHDDYGDRYSQNQQPYGQQQGAAPSIPPQGQPPAPNGDPGATGGNDPYAAWGGYTNYIAMWYAAMAQAGGQGNPQPPGAS